MATGSDRSEQLIVYLNDTRVGGITRLTDDRTIFAFDRSYISDPKRPVLSLSFKAEDGGLIEDTRPRRQKLLPFFSNLLPEGHLREYLAQHLSINSRREFFFLAALGDDLPGAVRIETDGELRDDVEEELLEETANNPHALRFSLAGVQLKFSAVLGSKGRLTIPVKGQGGSWIVKLPAGKFANVPDAEFATMTLAKRAGIIVPDFKLVPTGSIEGLPEEFGAIRGETFAVQRFDRGPAGERIHMEDFAQVFGLNSDDKYRKNSYANIAEVLWVEAGEKSLVEFIKRLVFNVAIGNGDMHLKNWSLLYKNGRKPELSPAYDFIPTIAFREGQALGLSLGDTKVFHEVDIERFRRLAASAKIPERLVIAAVQEAIEVTRSAWKSSRSDLPLLSEVAESIDKQINSVPLFNSVE